MLPLKGNQGRLHDDVVTFLDDPAREAAARTVDADHGRIETRTATVSTDIDWLQASQSWSRKFGPVGKVDRITKETIRNGKTKDAYA